LNTQGVRANVKEHVMSNSTAATRIRRSVVIAGAAAALAVLSPSAAHAEPIGWGGTLAPGQVQCFTRVAGNTVYQVRAEGSATKNGARFRFLRNGVVLDATSTDTVLTYAAERRTSSGNYPGPGTYEICAANHYATNTLVNLHILVNSEFI
jgi:hypothetical protein